MGKAKMKETAEDVAVKETALENSGARLLEIVTGLEDTLERIDLLKEIFKDRMNAAKAEGYDKAAVKALIKRRAMTEDQKKAQAELSLVIATYEGAVILAELADLGEALT